MLIKKEWFIDWFDSPYYHVLYSNRDDKEAHFFLTNLMRFLNAQPADDTIIDLACGKGRHSIFLNTLGFDVCGVDLSKQSIAAAKKHQNNRLSFEVQDLRTLHTEKKFTIALNLFTSFGYFQDKQEDEIVIHRIYGTLNKNGILVIDFMNSEKVIQQLIEHESKSISGIQFHISKWMENDFICKKVTVDDDDTTLEFTEKVQALTRQDFEQMLTQNGFKLLHTFGDYSLNPFIHATSDRLILIAQKVD